MFSVHIVWIIVCLVLIVLNYIWRRKDYMYVKARFEKLFEESRLLAEEAEIYYRLMMTIITDGESKTYIENLQRNIWSTYAHGKGMPPHWQAYRDTVRQRSFPRNLDEDDE